MVPTECASGRPGVFVDGVYHSEYLQPALDLAPAGAIVEVCAAAYLGPFVAPRPVELVGVGGAELTTLETLSGGTVLTVPAGSSVAGFTVRGGDSAIGGGLRLTGPGGFTVDGCRIEGNTAELGGGIAIEGGAVASILYTTVTGNLAQRGGGISVAAGSTAELVATVIGQNRAAVAGGGVTLDGGSLYGGEIVGNEVTSASPDEPPADGGGGVYATGAAILEGTVVSANRGSSAPGILVAGGSLTLADATVRENDGTDGRSLGGGLTCVNADVTMFGSVLSANRATNGGGLWAHGCTVTGGTISANEALDDGGGAVLFASTLFQAEISANTSGGYPTGVWLAGSASLVDALVAGHGGDWGVVEAGPASRVVGTSIVDNPACAILVSGQLAIASSAILRNEQGGCLLGGFNPTASLSSESTDWGTDDDDNTVDLSWGESYSYGADATFTCDDQACDPEV